MSSEFQYPFIEPRLPIHRRAARWLLKSFEAYSEMYGRGMQPGVPLRQEDDVLTPLDKRDIIALKVVPSELVHELFNVAQSDAAKRNN